MVRVDQLHKRSNHFKNKGVFALTGSSKFLLELENGKVFSRVVVIKVLGAQIGIFLSRGVSNSSILIGLLFFGLDVAVRPVVDQIGPKYLHSGQDFGA